MASVSSSVGRVPISCPGQSRCPAPSSASVAPRSVSAVRNKPRSSGVCNVASLNNMPGSDSGDSSGERKAEPLHPVARFLPRWLTGAAPVPRVRVRRAADRPLQQLADLAVLNERLNGNSPWEVRHKLDYFQKSKSKWEIMCRDVVTGEAAATLRTLEAAQRKVDAALSDEFRDGNSITDMRLQLEELQLELESAHKKLHQTQEMISMNEKKVQSLQQDAESLKNLSSVKIPEPEFADAAVMASVSAGVTQTLERAAPSAASAATVTAAPQQKQQQSTPSPSEKKNGKKPKKSVDLSSTLDLEEGLKDYWYPVEFSKNLTVDKLIPLEIFNDTFVLFRDENGAAACVVDECAHRACPLSLGSVVEGQIQCPYHGWEYDSTGTCTKMPSTVHCRGVQVKALSVQEVDGMIWVWAGDCKPYREIPDVGQPPEGHIIHSELVLEVPVEHGLLVENLLDLAHAPFTHTSTFARGWPIPDAVKFRMMSMLGGEWDPYPIDMSFEPPCITLSTIGLQQPGQVQRGARAAECEKHLRQMHVCLPSRPGHTRLLYRMSLDFLPVLKQLPFMDMVWKEMANRVLGEDLVLVQGQQKRMELGGNTWANPVSYDKLAVRYRRWRNSLSSDDETEKQEAEEALSSNMSAGELFFIDEDQCTIPQD